VIPSGKESPALSSGIVVVEGGGRAGCVRLTLIDLLRTTVYDLISSKCSLLSVCYHIKHFKHASPLLVRCFLA
jgi:hypothetical protein